MGICHPGEGTIKLRIGRLFAISISLCLALVLLLPGCRPLTPTNTPTPDPLTDVVVNADLIVLGNITDKRYDVVSVVSGNVTGKFAYTIYTLSVEKVIKGDPATKQVFIKVEGGWTGDAWQGSKGCSITDRMLVCLRKTEGNVYTVRPVDSGVLWSESSVISPQVIIRNGVVMDLEKWLGEIIVIMKANNIPIALPESEWSPDS